MGAPGAGAPLYILEPALCLITCIRSMCAEPPFIKPCSYANVLHKQLVLTVPCDSIIE